MMKRMIAIVMMLVVLVSAMPAVLLHAETKPTIYVVNDVYGAPGDTVIVKIALKNLSGRKVSRFEVKMDVGQATFVEQLDGLAITPAYQDGWAYISNVDTVGFGCLQGGLDESYYISVPVKIPTTAKEGDTLPIKLSVYESYTSVIGWEDQTMATSVSLEGANIHVTRVTPVSVSVMNTVASVGDSQIRVPVVMSKTTGKLATCVGLEFTISGSAAEKVEINRYASKEFAIHGVNQKYTVAQTDSDRFILQFSSGIENAVAPTTDAFKIFELVLDVKSPLESTDTLTVSLSAKDENAFKIYGDTFNDLVPLHVTEYVSGDVTIELPYEWDVVDETEATARLLRYTGDAATVEIPSIITGNGAVGTAGKQYTVTEIYGDTELETGVFFGNTNVQSIRIPETVKKIGECAIFGCKNLKTLIVKSTDLQVEETSGGLFLRYLKSAISGTMAYPAGLSVYGYESASIRTWASENNAPFVNLVAFIGVQQGADGIRFIGALGDLEYQTVSLKIEVKSEGKLYDVPVSTVFKTINGNVGGVYGPVVTTDADVYAEYPQAYYANTYQYLFGYVLKNVPKTGTFVFDITPMAVTVNGETVYGKSISVTYSDGVFVK